MRGVKNVFIGLLLLLLVGASGHSAKLFPSPTIDTPLAKTAGKRTVVLAGGCFWGTQAVFEHVRGVIKATAGYAGGEAGSAHYETVSSGTSGHAESVQIVYDPSLITLGTLLKIFFSVAHDPTELNRQGPDTGTQYRSAVFLTDSEQDRITRAYIAQLDKARIFKQPIVTQISPLERFYPAEEYHQGYCTRHPYDLYVVINDAPKLSRLKSLFPALYRK